MEEGEGGEREGAGRCGGREGRWPPYGVSTHPGQHQRQHLSADNPDSITNQHPLGIHCISWSHNKAYITVVYNSI
jgi:hypothetical protein